MISRSSITVVVALSLFVGNLPAQQKSPFVQEIVNAVNSDSVTATLQELTGMKEVTIDGRTVTIKSRSNGSQGHIDAGQYVTRRLHNFGCTVSQQTFTAYGTGMNVVAVQAGTISPNVIYIVCAHYDDNPSFATSNIAPGADDDASGVSAVIEAARILSQYRVASTIVFALWDLEEIGQGGSLSYAKDRKAENATIAGVLNLDMIGWDKNNDNKCEIHLVDTACARQLADTIVFTNRTYSVGLMPVVINPGLLNSDHARFIQQGYSAVMLTENYNGDFNDKYHTTSDSVRYLNMSYLHKQIQLCVGAVAQVAGIQGVTAIEQPATRVPTRFALEQNYPNPFNPSTTISFSLPSNSSVTLKVFDVLGREVATITSEELSAGNYTRQWDASGLPSGVYFYRLQAGAYTQTKRLSIVR